MKQDLRRTMRAKRAALSAEQANDKNQAIHQRIFHHKACQDAGKILIYLNFRSEINTRPLIDRWLEEKRQVYVPVMEPETRTIFPVRIFEDYRELPVNSYGIQEPSLEGAEILKADQLDLVVVPGLAFDRQGFRLGYGGGYYDRLIPKLRKDAKTIALCYSFQLVKEVPIGPYDQKVQSIITEYQEENL